MDFASAEPTTRRRAVVGVVVVAVAALTAVGHVSWMSLTGFLTRPPSMDAGWDRLDADAMLDRLRDGGVGRWLTEGITRPGTHPPLLQMLVGMVASFTGGEVTTGTYTIVMTGALVAFVLGAWRLARSVAGPRAAALAAALAATAPVVLTSPRQLRPQFAMAAASLWALNAIVRSEGFTRRGPSIAAGCLVAIAALVKMLAPVEVAGAVIVAAAMGWAREGWKRVFANLALAGAACAALAAPWYATNLASALRYARWVSDAEGQARFSGSLGTFDLGRWTYYPLNLVNNGFGAMLAAGVLASAVLLFVCRRRAADAAPDGGRSSALAVMLAAPIVAFPVITLGTVTLHSHYVVGFIPVGCALVGAAVDRLSGKPRTTAFTVGIVIALLDGVLALRSPRADVPLATIGPIELLGQADPLTAPQALAVGEPELPGSEASTNVHVAGRMLRETTRPEPRFVVVHPVGAEHPFISPQNILHEIHRLGREAEAVDFDEFLSASGGVTMERLRSLDFVVLDERLMESGTLLAALDAARVPASSAGRVFIGPRSTIALVRIEPDDAERPDSRPLEKPGVQRVNVRFSLGLTLRGFAIGGGVGTAPGLRTIWSQHGMVPTPLDAVVYLEQPGEPARPRRFRLRADPLGEGELRVITFDGFDSPGRGPAIPANVPARFRLALVPGGEHSTPATIESSDLPKVGGSWVAIPLGDAPDGAASRGR